MMPSQLDKLEGKGLCDGSQNNRFSGVFTKLRVFDFSGEYDKVIMMDADLLLVHQLCGPARWTAAAPGPNEKRWRVPIKVAELRKTAGGLSHTTVCSR